MRGQLQDSGIRQGSITNVLMPHLDPINADRDTGVRTLYEGQLQDSGTRHMRGSQTVSTCSLERVCFSKNSVIYDLI